MKLGLRLNVPKTIRIVMVEPEKAGNIGSIARSMKNFAQNDLWIISPKVRIDDEAKAYAMHGTDVLASAKIRESMEEALKDIDLIVGTSSIVPTNPSNLARLSITPRNLAEKVSKVHGRIAIIFGRESSGLNNEEVERCDLMVTIPANKEYNVLNLASAASIILYELFQQEISEAKEFQLATEAARLRLFQQFDLMLTLIDLQEHRRELARRAFRNLISRAFISKREASLLLGALRKTSSHMV
jgi:tRNA/rRNA methyltransferase